MTNRFVSAIIDLIKSNPQVRYTYDVHIDNDNDKFNGYYQLLNYIKCAYCSNTIYFKCNNTNVAFNLNSRWIKHYDQQLKYQNHGLILLNSLNQGCISCVCDIIDFLSQKDIIKFKQRLHDNAHLPIVFDIFYNKIKHKTEMIDEIYIISIFDDSYSVIIWI